MTIQELGKLGESLAENYLSLNGYHVIDRNVRFKRYEIDLVAEWRDYIIIVEVKTRQTDNIGEPWRAITKSKQRQIIKVADHYIKRGRITKHARFDVISIVHHSHETKIEHIPDAFYPC